MDSAHSFMVEWTENFLKNKDILTKKIVSIERNKGGFDLFIKYKDREQYVSVVVELKNLDSIINKINNNSYFTIVALNSKENFEALLKNWKRLVDFKFLSIMLVNPFSGLDKKWIIFPYTHHKICDESSLELGLKSMFETVEQIGESQLIAKIKS
mgnify:FL=1